MSSIKIIFFLFMLFISEGIFYSGRSTEFFKDVDKNEIIYPKIVSRREVKSRFKRSNIDDEKNSDDSIYVSFKNWIIKTNLNNNLIIPSHFKVQWANSGDHKKSHYQNNLGIDRCFPLEGEIIGVENSQISLTICDNYYYGLVIVDNKYFFLQPSSTNGSHVFYETQLPGSIISIMDKYNANFRKKSEYKDDHKKNKIHLKDKTQNGESNQCHGWEVSKVGTQYIQLDPKLCPGNYIKKNNSKVKLEPKRLRRHLRKFNYRNNSFPHQPYRVFKTCGNNRRRKRVLTVCDANEEFDMSDDVAFPEYSSNYEEFNAPRSRLLNLDDMGYSLNEKNSFHKDYGNRVIRDGQTSQKKLIKNKMKWLKIVIGVDFDVIEFHGQLTEHYIFTIFNIVSSLFKKLSTAYTVNIVILKIMMFPNPEDSAIRGEDEIYPLYAVNKWSRELKDSFSMAMWYTHFPLNAHGKTCYNSKMCDQQWSCIIARDDGWISSIKIAHTIGHLVGLSHDGDLESNNSCATEAILEGTIMGKSLPDIIPVPTWSQCSTREFHTYVDNYRCLARPPVSHQVAGYLTGTFTLDEQCRIEFGDSYIFCLSVTITDPCRELWCSRAASRKRICTTRKTQTLEGTPCGRGKKCINAICTDPYRSTTESKPSSFPITPVPISSSLIPSWSAPEWIISTSASILPIFSSTEMPSFSSASSLTDWSPSTSPLNWSLPVPPIQPLTNWSLPSSQPPSSNWTSSGITVHPANWTDWITPTNSRPPDWSVSGPSVYPTSWSDPSLVRPPSEWGVNGSPMHPAINWPSPQRPPNGAPSNGASSNGVSSNGVSSNGAPSNGGSSNGGSLNGGSLNGGSLNGGSLNGGSSNGGSSNGGSSNGASSNGAYSNGVPSYSSSNWQSPSYVPSEWSQPNGMPSNGMPSNGVPSNGVPSNGMPSNGVPSNGVSSNGFSSNGMPPNGMSVNGLSFNGLPSNGFPSNGVVTQINGQGQFFANSNGQTPLPSKWFATFTPLDGQQNWSPVGPPIQNRLSNVPTRSPSALISSRSLTSPSTWYSSRLQTSSVIPLLYNQSTFNSRNYLPGQLTFSNQQSRNNLPPNLSNNQFYSSPNHSLHRNLTANLLTYRSLLNSSAQAYNHSRNNSMNYLLNNTFYTSKLGTLSGPFFN